MKKFINNPDDVIRESMEGFAAAYPNYVKAYYDPNYITRIEKAENKVALLSGGGSGHEPLHSGYVGKGMLDGACPGEMFTSPTPDQMYEAGKAIDSGKGVLQIIKNYTGDVMNFEMAADLLHADGIEVESVIINDDVAVKDSLYTAGRRGVGGTVLAEKITGAAAEAGLGLQEVKAICERVNAQTRTMGAALRPCTVPGADKPSFDLPEDKYELGIGIHGEPGRKQIDMEPADKIVKRLMEPILTDLPFKEKDEVLLFVNGMGGTPEIELYILYRKALAIAKKAGLQVIRDLVGSYITSIEMQGASITLLKLDDELKRYWDAPADTPGFHQG